VMDKISNMLFRRMLGIAVLIACWVATDARVVISII